jgi:outer membrane lipoprotein-sorting protein
MNEHAHFGRTGYTVESVRYDEMHGTRLVNHRRISFVQPFRFRIEDLSPATASVEGGISPSSCPRMTDVINDQVRSSCQEDLKQFSRMAIDPRKEDPAVQFAPRIPDHLDGVEFESDEMLSLGGRRHDCAVVRGHHSNGSYLTAWIDKQQRFVVKWNIITPQAPTSVTIEVISIQANPPLADALFTFDPPAGWHQSSTVACSASGSAAQPVQ